MRTLGRTAAGRLLSLALVVACGVTGITLTPGMARAQTVVPLLRFSVAPSVVTLGSTVTVTSVDPCPIPSGAAGASVTVEQQPPIVALGVPLVPSGTVIPGPEQGPPVPYRAPSQFPVHPDGSWSGALQVAGQTGIATFTASCATTTDETYAQYAPTTVAVRTGGAGYWFAWSDGTITTAGDAPQMGEMLNEVTGSLVGLAPLRTDGDGYWGAASDGGVFAFGDAGFFGSAVSLKLNAPIVGIASTPDGDGYWLIGRDGGVFAFGNAPFLGSAVGAHSPCPVGSASGCTALAIPRPFVGIATTPDGNGYWLVDNQGYVYAYGDAPSFSPGPLRLNAAVVGIAATPDGRGYWLVAADGGVFAFGDAGFYGSMAGRPLNRLVVSLSPAPDGQGYRLAAADGGVFAFGTGTFLGAGAEPRCPPALSCFVPAPVPTGSVVAIASTPPLPG
jgi:hypothetical protein